MKRLQGAVVGLWLLAGVAGHAVAGPADDCKCWYEGFEDGLEFSWDNRAFAEKYARCAKSGMARVYEDGFKASQNAQARKCPMMTK